MNSFTPELQLKHTESVIKNKLKTICSMKREFKFVTTLVLKFKEIEADDDETQHSTFYSSSKAEIIIYDTCIDDTLESI